MNKAVFWDRDGILNSVMDREGFKNVGPQKFEDFKLIKNVDKVLQRAKSAGYLNIVVTNQSDVARNIISWPELDRMHDFLKANMPAIDAIYICPHTGEQNCRCRKPKSGLFLDAAKDYNLNLFSCFMVGDTQSDIDAGKTIGVKSILFKTHYNGEVKNADFQVESMEEVLKIIASEADLKIGFG